MGLSGLTGKVAVVAGGATGIGAATAARLAAEGCLVVVGDVALDAAGRTITKNTRPDRDRKCLQNNVIREAESSL